jgi:hypothetical protein
MLLMNSQLSFSHNITISKFNIMLIISTQLYNYVHFNVSCLDHQISSIIKSEKLQQSCCYWINYLHIERKIGQNENFGYTTIPTTFVQICTTLKFVPN